MQKKHMELIQYLNKHTNAITSKHLADALHLSIRTVKSYIRDINLSTNSYVIDSSKSGYILNKKRSFGIIAQNEKKLPETSEDRAKYIIKQLLIEHTSMLNIYDLCDTLYVSYSTLKADIGKMNKAFANFHVSFYCENDSVHVVGNEKALRKLISHIMYEETDNQFMDTQIIQESFKSIPMDQIAASIKRIFGQYNYYINDFAYINLLLHIAIILDRIKEGRFVNQVHQDIEIESIHEQMIISELCHSFEQEFDVYFNEYEKFELYMLFKTNANYSMPSNHETLKKVVGQDILELSLMIATKVNDTYFVDISNESFLAPFSLHLKNLLLRASNGTYIKNPMTQSIKNSCPTVYDMAIFISIELMQKYQFHLHEDEITFLALHIGAEIERQKTNAAKVKCVLYCPKYMEISNQLYHQLLIDFGTNLDITHVIASEGELASLDFDLLISMVNVFVKPPKRIIILPPFYNQGDRRNINNAIDIIHRDKKNKILKRHFDLFFSHELFVENVKETTRDSIVRLLSNKMIQMEYVNADFEEKVNIREKAASTAFHKIAIPHSLQMDALKTSIAVAISKNGINWNGQSIHVVLLVAINKADKKLFHELYESLVDLFSEQNILNLMKHCTNFKDFQSIIFDNIATSD